MDIYTTIVRFFQDGGLFMYPIVLVLALGLAIAIERYVFLSMSGTSNRRLWKKIAPLLQSGSYNQAQSITAKSKTAVASILSYGFDRIQSARRRDDVEKAMEESMMEVLPRLEKRTHYLATFANRLPCSACWAQLSA